MFRFFLTYFPDLDGSLSYFELSFDLEENISNSNLESSKSQSIEACPIESPKNNELKATCTNSFEYECKASTSFVRSPAQEVDNQDTQNHFNQKRKAQFSDAIEECNFSDTDHADQARTQLARDLKIVIKRCNSNSNSKQTEAGESSSKMMRSF